MTSRIGALSAAALGAATAGIVAAASGGYFETSWGWIALALFWAAGLGLVLTGTANVSFAETIFALAFGGLLAWTLASTIWAPSADEPVREAERLLIYVAAALVAPLLLRRGQEVVLLASLLVGITAVATYALGTRLFPSRLLGANSVEAYRLDEPLGYWNALGILCALGIVLAVGFVASARSSVGRALAAASLVLLSPAVYFTFSRGAWVALGLGLLAMLALDPHRLRVAVAAVMVAPAPVLAVWLASTSPGLTQVSTTLEQATEDGRQLALALLLLVLVAAALAVGFHALERRVSVPRHARLVGGLSALAAAVAAVAAVFVIYGSPVSLAERTYDEFQAPPPKTGGDLNARLFNLSSPGRYHQWKVAWTMVENHPGLGAGAGTYERYWHRDRPVGGKIRDAHSLYLETLAELGPVGLGLLLLALGVPLVVAVKARRHHLVPVAFGAYVAYLAHAAVDWDWEMPAVTLTALLIGSAILVAARGERVTDLSPRLRGALFVAILPLAGFALVGQIGNDAVAASQDAPNRRTAIAEARKAIRWAPWSADAIEQLGEAQFEYGSPRAARTTFLRALEKNPDDWDLWFDLAIVSDGAPLRQAVARATELNPLDPELAALRLALELQDKVTDATP